MLKPPNNPPTRPPALAGKVVSHAQHQSPIHASAKGSGLLTLLTQAHCDLVELARRPTATLCDPQPDCEAAAPGESVNQTQTSSIFGRSDPIPAHLNIPFNTSRHQLLDEFCDAAARCFALRQWKMFSAASLSKGVKAHWQKSHCKDPHWRTRLITAATRNFWSACSHALVWPDSLAAFQASYWPAPVGPLPLPVEGTGLPPVNNKRHRSPSNTPRRDKRRRKGATPLPAASSVPVMTDPVNVRRVMVDASCVAFGRIAAERVNFWPGDSASSPGNVASSNIEAYAARFLRHVLCPLLPVEEDVSEDPKPPNRSKDFKENLTSTSSALKTVARSRGKSIALLLPSRGSPPLSTETFPHGDEGDGDYNSNQRFGSLPLLTRNDENYFMTARGPSSCRGFIQPMLPTTLVEVFFTDAPPTPLAAAHLIAPFARTQEVSSHLACSIKKVDQGLLDGHVALDIEGTRSKFTYQSVVGVSQPLSATDLKLLASQAFSTAVVNPELFAASRVLTHLHKVHCKSQLGLSPMIRDLMQRQLNFARQQSALDHHEPIVIEDQVSISPLALQEHMAHTLLKSGNPAEWIRKLVQFPIFFVLNDQAVWVPTDVKHSQNRLCLGFDALLFLAKRHWKDKRKRALGGIQSGGVALAAGGGDQTRGVRRPGNISRFVLEQALEQQGDVTSSAADSSRALKAVRVGKLPVWATALRSASQSSNDLWELSLPMLSHFNQVGGALMAPKGPTDALSRERPPPEASTFRFLPHKSCYLQRPLLFARRVRALPAQPDQQGLGGDHSLQARSHLWNISNQIPAAEQASICADQLSMPVCLSVESPSRTVRRLVLSWDPIEECALWNSVKTQLPDILPRLLWCGRGSTITFRQIVDRLKIGLDALPENPSNARRGDDPLSNLDWGLIAHYLNSALSPLDRSRSPEVCEAKFLSLFMEYTASAFENLGTDPTPSPSTRPPSPSLPTRQNDLPDWEKALINQLKDVGGFPHEDVAQHDDEAHGPRGLSEIGMEIATPYKLIVDEEEKEWDDKIVDLYLDQLIDIASTSTVSSLEGVPLIDRTTADVVLPERSAEKKFTRKIQGVVACLYEAATTARMHEEEPLDDVVKRMCISEDLQQVFSVCGSHYQTWLRERRWIEEIHSERSLVELPEFSLTIPEKQVSTSAKFTRDYPRLKRILEDPNLYPSRAMALPCLCAVLELNIPFLQFAKLLDDYEGQGLVSTSALLYLREGNDRQSSGCSSFPAVYCASESGGGLSPMKLVDLAFCEMRKSMHEFLISVIKMGTCVCQLERLSTAVRSLHENTEKRRKLQASGTYHENFVLDRPLRAHVQSSERCNDVLQAVRDLLANDRSSAEPVNAARVFQTTLVNYHKLILPPHESQMQLKENLLLGQKQLLPSLANQSMAALLMTADALSQTKTKAPTNWDSLPMAGALASLVVTAKLVTARSRYSSPQNIYKPPPILELIVDASLPIVDRPPPVPALVLRKPPFPSLKLLPLPRALPRSIKPLSVRPEQARGGHPPRGMPGEGDQQQPNWQRYQAPPLHTVTAAEPATRRAPPPISARSNSKGPGPAMHPPFFGMTHAMVGMAPPNYAGNQQPGRPATWQTAPDPNAYQRHSTDGVSGDQYHHHSAMKADARMYGYAPPPHQSPPSVPPMWPPPMTPPTHARPRTAYQMPAQIRPQDARTSSQWNQQPPTSTYAKQAPPSYVSMYGAAGQCPDPFNNYGQPTPAQRHQHQMYPNLANHQPQYYPPGRPPVYQQQDYYAHASRAQEFKNSPAAAAASYQPPNTWNQTTHPEP